MQAIWRGDSVKSVNRGTRASGAVSAKNYQAIPVDDYQAVPVKDYEAVPVKEYQSVPLKEYRSIPVKEYRSVSLVPSLSWSSDDEDPDDDIVLRDFTKSESECPLLYEESGKKSKPETTTCFKI